MGSVTPQKHRFECLDGLRGLAAVIVVFNHFASAYFPALMFDQGRPVWPIAGTPLYALYNGGMAVSIFFVLSGFVVADAAAKKALGWFFQLIHRYARLAIPVLGGTLFAWALLKAFPHSIASLRAFDDHPFLSTTYTYDKALPGPLYAVYDGLFRVFVKGLSYFDTVLWTMKLELSGSLALYLVWRIEREWLRWAIAIAVGAVCVVFRKPELTAFAVGAMMRDITVTGRLDRRWALPAFVFGLAMAALSPLGAEIIHLPALPDLLKFGEPHKVWQVIGAVALVYAVISSRVLSRWLSTPFMRWLGAVSFSLYLVHVPLALTVFAPIFLAVHSSAVGIAALLGGFLVTSLAVGHVFMLLVDNNGLLALRHAKKAYLARRPAPAL